MQRTTRTTPPSTLRNNSSALLNQLVGALLDQVALVASPDEGLFGLGKVVVKGRIKRQVTAPRPPIRTTARIRLQVTEKLIDGCRPLAHDAAYNVNQRGMSLRKNLMALGDNRTRPSLLRHPRFDHLRVRRLVHDKGGSCSLDRIHGHAVASPRIHIGDDARDRGAIVEDVPRAAHDAEANRTLRRRSSI